MMSWTKYTDAGIVRHVILASKLPRLPFTIMFINIIIDLLLPMSPRVVTAAHQRALNTLTRSSESSDSLHARTLVDVHPKDFVDAALLNEGVTPLYNEDQAAMITSDIQPEHLRDARAAHTEHE